MNPQYSTSASPSASASAQVAAQVLPGEHLHALRGRIRGAVHLPGDPEWDAARRAWQLLADQRPAAVVVAADVADVVATVQAARRLGLAVAPQATGHAAGAVPSLEDTILLRTSALQELAVDPAAARMRVGAGVVWSDAVAAAGEHGLAAVAGMAPSVGVVGFTLGGGLGWLARSHGLAASGIRAIEAVDALGRVVRIDEDHHPDLFWAARGGVAPVIVTAIEVQLHPIPELWAGAMMWPLEHAADVAHAWREWIRTVPDSVTSLARVLRYPDIPQIPPFLRGRSLVAVEAAIQEDAETAAALLAPLRALAPEIDTVRALAPAELGTVHGDPVDPAPAHGEAIVLSEISPASIDALLEAALSPAAAALLSIELRHLGGRLTPGRADGDALGGAVATIDGAGLVYAVGIVPVPEALEPVRAAAAALIARLRPFASPVLVKNFAEAPVPASALFGPVVERLREVVGAWDPERIIRTGHPIG